jgi:hypothetical protein
MKRILTLAGGLGLLAAAACGAPPGQMPTDQIGKMVVARPSQSQNQTISKNDWTYVVKIRNPGTRSEGLEGRLYYKGREIMMPRDPGGYYDTPLGRFFHSGIEPGYERLPWDDTGWILQTVIAPGNGGSVLPWPGQDQE